MGFSQNIAGSKEGNKWRKKKAQKLGNFCKDRRDLP
jgi:hypothetical protein